MRWLIPALVLFAACGSSSDSDTLTLRGGDFTEEEFRTNIRALFAGIDSEAFCQSLNGLSDSDVADTLKAVNDRQGVTPKQDADPNDEARAGAIVKEECARIN